MDPIAVTLALQAQRTPKSRLRRAAPFLLVLTLVLPLFFVLLVAGGAATMVSGSGAKDNGPNPATDAVVSGSCAIGGAVNASNVKATFKGLPYKVDQVQNAQTIVGVGRTKKVPAYGWVVAVAAAMTESTLHNLDHGDRDSLGLFQMRPSMGWGTHSQLTDPTYAANKFYDVLLKVPGWQGMSVTQAAQAVERSGFPDAYAANEADARRLVADPVVLGASCVTEPVLAKGGAGTPVQQRVIAAAMAQLGVQYAWGGGDWNGPTYGVEYGSNTYGFDCSGLTGYAWYQGSGGKVKMETYTGNQMDDTVAVTKEQAQAGDLLLFPGHVGLYDGKGNMIHAPHTGTVVQVTPNIWNHHYWMGKLLKIGRPKEYLAMTQPGPAPTAAAAAVR